MHQHVPHCYAPLLHCGLRLQLRAKHTCRSEGEAREDQEGRKWRRGQSPAHDVHPRRPDVRKARRSLCPTPLSRPLFSLTRGLPKGAIGCQPRFPRGASCPQPKNAAPTRTLRHYGMTQRVAEGITEKEKWRVCFLPRTGKKLGSGIGGVEACLSAAHDYRRKLSDTRVSGRADHGCRKRSVQSWKYWKVPERM